MRMSDWSSDVGCSDLQFLLLQGNVPALPAVPEGTFRVQGWVEMRIGHSARAVVGIERCLPVHRIQVRYPHGMSGIRKAGDRKIPERDRKSVVSGKSVSVRVDIGGRRIIKKKKQ